MADSTADLHARIDHNLTNHPPVDGLIVELFEELRAQAKTFGHLIVDDCPPSRERSLALTHLEQAVMWAVASIARDQQEVLDRVGVED